MKIVIHPSVPGLASWLRTQKPQTVYSFEAPTSCVLAQYFGANFNTQGKKDDPRPAMPRLDGGNWSSIFPGETEADRVREYHRICNQKPFTFAGVLERISGETLLPNPPGHVKD